MLATEASAHIICQWPEPTENSGKYLLGLRGARLPAPAFSKVADWLVFRYAAIQNSFENGQEAQSLLSATAWPGSSETLVIENDPAVLRQENSIGSQCEHDRPLASTALRWQARWHDNVSTTLAPLSANLSKNLLCLRARTRPIAEAPTPTLSATIARLSAARLAANSSWRTNGAKTHPGRPRTRDAEPRRPRPARRAVRRRNGDATIVTLIEIRPVRGRPASAGLQPLAAPAAIAARAVRFVLSSLHDLIKVRPVAVPQAGRNGGRPTSPFARAHSILKTDVAPRRSAPRRNAQGRPSRMA